MIVCGFRVLFLLTPSSIIPVSLTLRLHFVAHYRGRGDGPKEGLLQKMLQRPGGKETDRKGWAGGHRWFRAEIVLALGFFSSTLFLSGKHSFGSMFASLCAFSRLDWFSISESLGVQGCLPARLPAWCSLMRLSREECQ